MEQCVQCGYQIEDWDSGYYARGMLCLTCYQRKVESDALKPCRRCGLRVRPDLLREFRGQNICPNCVPEAQAEVERHECVLCRRWIKDWEARHHLPDGRLVCGPCHDASGKGGERIRSRVGEGAKPGTAGAAPAGRDPRRKIVTYYRPGAPVGEPVSLSRPLFSDVVDRLGRYLGGGRSGGAGGSAGGPGARKRPVR